jgi:hypothetical protein
MQRRTLLHVAAAALPTALAGCGATSTAPETATETTPTTTPTTTESATVVTPIRELWSAYNDGNETGFVAAFHPDAPNPPEADTMDFQGTVTIENTTVVSQSEDSATVRGNITLASDGGSETQTQVYDVRRYEDEWAVWSVELVGGSGSEPEPTPQVAFAFEYDESATSNAGDGVLTVIHEGGDTVAASQLTVQGDGITTVAGTQPDVTAAGTEWERATGTEEVAAGTSLTVGVRSDCRIRLVWMADDGETSATLAAYDGPDA